MNIFIKYFVFIYLLFISNFNCIVYGQEKYKPTIAIDLDGVLNNYTKYERNNIPEIKEGIIEFIERLNKQSYNLFNAIFYSNIF